MLLDHDTCPFLHHYQSGSGLPYYAGSYQNGEGIGSLLGSLAKTALPLLRSGAKFVGKSLLNAGCDVANDMFDGHTLKSSVKKRVFNEQPQEGEGYIIQSKKRKTYIRRKTSRRKKLRKINSKHNNITKKNKIKRKKDCPKKKNKYIDIDIFN